MGFWMDAIRRHLKKRIAAVPLVDNELWPRSMRSIVMTCVTGCAAALIIWSTYRGGVDRGMDHVIAFGLEIDAIPITIALSESVYGVDLGYVGLTNVYTAFMKTILQGSTDPNDALVQRNIRSREVINNALSAASSLPDQRIGSISERTLMTTMYLDIGSVDYITLSFGLFGNRIEALYYAYFLIIGASSLLFLVTFPNAIAAQVVLICTLFALRLELLTPIFGQGMPTFAGARHSSTLCLIPAWHFALLTVFNRRFSWTLLVLAVGQLAFLILAITVRATAVWTVLFLAVLGAVCGLTRWFTLSSGERTWKRLAWIAVPWPVVVLVVTTVLHQQHVQMKLHPVYFTDDVIPHHPVWHSAYVGLQYSPELYGFPVRQELLGSDAIAFEGAIDYLRSTHFITDRNGVPTYDVLKAGGYFSDWNGGNPKWRLHDEIMRRVFFQIARKHPLKMIQLYALKKPKAVWDVTIDLVRRADPRFKGLMLVCGLATAVLWVVFASQQQRVEGARLVVVGAGAAVTALLPCLWAYPVAWSVTDGLLLAFGTAVLATGLVVAVSYGVLTEAVGRRTSRRSPKLFGESRS